MNPWLEPEDECRSGLMLGVCLLAWSAMAVVALLWSLLA